MTKRDYLKDLSKIENHIDATFLPFYSILLTQFYLYLNKSTHVQKKLNKGLTYYSIRLLRFIQGVIVKNKQIKADILVWIADSSHVKQLVSVCDKLSNKGYRIHFLSYKNKLLKSKELIHYPHTYVPTPNRLSVSNEKLTRAMESIQQASRKSGIEPWNKEEVELILNCLKDWYGFAENFYHTIQTVINKSNAVAAITGYDIPLEGKAFTLACNTQCKTTFMMQHGSVTIPSYLFATHQVNNYLIYGETSYQILKQVGCSSQLAITGPTYLDVQYESIKQQIINRKGKVEKVLIALTGPGHSTSQSHHEKIISLLATFVGDQQELEFYVKLHNKDNLAFYESIINKTNVKMEIPSKSNNIFDWILHCDVLITTASTVAQEAMICKKPVLCIDLEKAYTDLEFIQCGAVYNINTDNLLKETIYNLRNGQNDLTIENAAAKHVQDFFGPLDGQASLRCMKYIEQELLKNGR